MDFLKFDQERIQNSLKKLLDDNFDYDNEKYSAVLVPTAGIYKDVNFSWHPSSNSVLRAKLGEKMAKKYNLPLIISGGKIELSGKSEAETVGKIINYNNIILETYSRNSYETSKNMPGVYDKNQLNKELSILLVTSAKHSLRMSLALEKKGFKAKIKVEHGIKELIKVFTNSNDKIINNY